MHYHLSLRKHGVRRVLIGFVGAERSLDRSIGVDVMIGKFDGGEKKMYAIYLPFTGSAWPGRAALLSAARADGSSPDIFQRINSTKLPSVYELRKVFGATLWYDTLPQFLFSIQIDGVMISNSPHQLFRIKSAGAYSRHYHNLSFDDKQTRRAADGRRGALPSDSSERLIDIDGPNEDLSLRRCLLS
ncbi:hypothetical protein EVAR_47248_1 [Eumeta japonica]|uniref:Uncharacterized protein n=1 Tax=Eumeta variegata TaxID=151549 RepID=A0A4C1XGQ5_EUMVA|nr:hypothetical protein EVAR_47248_1 [Eumeta japonica]